MRRREARQQGKILLNCMARNNEMTVSRRGWIGSTVAGIAAAAVAASSRAAEAAPAVRRGIPLGYDNFAVRAMGWNARQLVDHAETLQCDSLFITDFGPFEGRHDDATLGELRRYAADKGVAIALGSWSICPGSGTFKNDWGTAEEHLVLGIRMAEALGSPAFRVVLGNGGDRLSEGGIEARIAETVQVLKAVRSRALDAGVKIAVENHAGDLRASELKSLIEEAGRDYVGANFDSGNACWTLEDPVVSLATLGSLVATTSLRDTMLWETERGITAQWTAMGEGCVDLPAFFDRFAADCPGVAVHIETISGFPREMKLFDREFWQAYPKLTAEELAPFLELARRGHAIEPSRLPDGPARKEAEQQYQLAEIERSISYCREALGLGLRG
jgi:sugar phosphate isomerase/epimerase